MAVGTEKPRIYRSGPGLSGRDKPGRIEYSDYRIEMPSGGKFSYHFFMY